MSRFYLIFFIFLPSILQTNTTEYFHIPNQNISFTYISNQELTQKLPRVQFHTAMPSRQALCISNRYFPTILPNRKNYSQWSTEKFLAYLFFIYKDNLVKHQNEILQMHSFYQYEGFLGAIKTLPKYECYILKLARRIHKKFFTKLKYSISGLKNTIYRLEKEIHTEHKQKQWRTEHQKLKKQEKEKLVLQQRQQTERLLQSRFETQHSNLEKIYHKYKEQTNQTSNTKEHIQKRITSLEHHLQSKNKQSFYSRSYHINQTAKEKCYVYCNNTTNMKNCFGNQLQHNVWEEFVDILNKLTCCTSLEQLHDLEKLTYQIISLGFDATKSGLISHAYTLANFCWGVLDFANALGEGFVLGTCNVGNMLRHPINAIGDVVEGLATLIYFVGRPAYDVLDITCTYPFNAESAKEKYKASYKRMRTTYDTVTNYFKQNNWQEVVRDTSALVTEGFLLHRCAQNIKAFYSSTKTKARTYFKQPSQQLTVTTAEGIQIKIADEAGMLFAEIDETSQKVGRSSKKIITANNTKEMLDLKIWQEKIVPNCQNKKINGRKAVQMTKKIKGLNLNKGDILYLDKLHKDHIEVFNNKGRVRLVMNLDLTINEKKTYIAKKQNRKIKV